MWKNYNIILRILFSTNFKDISTGSRLIKKSLVQKIKLTSNSPFVGAELAIKSKYSGYNVEEIGIHTYPRTFGTGSSVMTTSVFLFIFLHTFATSLTDKFSFTQLNISLFIFLFSPTNSIHLTTSIIETKLLSCFPPEYKVIFPLNDEIFANKLGIIFKRVESKDFP